MKKNEENPLEGTVLPVVSVMFSAEQAVVLPLLLRGIKERTREDGMAQKLCDEVISLLKQATQEQLTEEQQTEAHRRTVMNALDNLIKAPHEFLKFLKSLTRDDIDRVFGKEDKGE